LSNAGIYCLADRSMKNTLRCPACRREVERNSAFLPFCSDRCRLIDLGRWVSEGYRIKGEKVESEERVEGEVKEQEKEDTEESAP
jgi:uncharacterized protein